MRVETYERHYRLPGRSDVPSNLTGQQWPFSVFWADTSAFFPLFSGRRKNVTGAGHSATLASTREWLHGVYMNRLTTTALLILDGWGIREEQASNAIAAADTPRLDHLWEQAPHARILTSGREVGLPDGQMGNSEVGHMNLGAGRVVHQELTRIDKEIAEGAFERNPVLVESLDQAIKQERAVHIIGLLSDGGVHASEQHILAMINMAAARGARQVYVHAFLDGRDTPPRSAHTSLRRADALLKELGVGYVASIVGRYYAMDRDLRWERIEKAWQLLVRGKAEYSATCATEGLDAAYARGENDEFVQATAIVPGGQQPMTMAAGSAVIFMNFRTDRARQLARTFTQKTFEPFDRGDVPALSSFVTLTRYADDIEAPCAYPPQQLANTLGEYVARRGMSQLRIAETEKYAHVTFFFNGGREQPWEGEKRILIESPGVATYDLQPEMSALEVTDKLVEAIESNEFDLIVCNYANGDMVGHTGVFEAAVKAVECVDRCVGRVVDALQRQGGQCLITADHGNAEKMLDEVTGQPHTAHTCGPVPLIYAGSKEITLEDGVLADITPTLLALMGLPQPSEMSGRNLGTARAADTA